MNIKKFAAILVVFTLALGIVSGINYVMAGNVTPPASYPNCPPSEPACNTPINVSATNQTKDGGLGVGTFLASLAAQFKQDVTVNQLASTQEKQQVVCSDSNGKLIKCTNAIVNAKDPLTVTVNSYCGGAGSAPSTPSQLDYYQIGDAVHVYGIVRFNMSSNAQCLSAGVSGLPKPFPSSGSPVITERSAVLTYYGPAGNPSWKSISGVMEFNSSGGSNVLAFSRYDNAVLTDPKTVPAGGEWMAFVDFTY